MTKSASEQTKPDIEFPPIPDSTIRELSWMPSVATAAQIKSMALEIERLRAERPGWRTMESAPKDGTLVLLYEDCIPASVQIGRWEEDGECWAADPGGWSVEVAMWQPLPALHPSGAASGEELEIEKD